MDGYGLGNQELAVKIGHICLSTASDATVQQFAALVESLDRLAIEQHVLVASKALARRLQGCTHVSIGPIVRTPVMAYCLMPDIDVAHIHDEKSGQAGLLLTLTRSVPFVMTGEVNGIDSLNPLRRSVLHRADSFVSLADLADTEKLVRVYRRTSDAWSKLPENANRR